MKTVLALLLLFGCAAEPSTVDDIWSEPGKLEDLEKGKQVKVTTNEDGAVVSIECRSKKPAE